MVLFAEPWAQDGRPPPVLLLLLPCDQLLLLLLVTWRRLCLVPQSSDDPLTTPRVHKHDPLHTEFRSQTRFDLQRPRVLLAAFP